MPQARQTNVGQDRSTPASTATLAYDITLDRRSTGQAQKISEMKSRLGKGFTHAQRPYLFTLLFLLVIQACDSSMAPTLTITPVSTPTATREQIYKFKVDAFVDNFYEHRRDYNAGLEQIGLQIRNARSETERREAFQQAISHLESARQSYKGDMDYFARTFPPPKFEEFYLLMNSVLRDYVEATGSFVTYYSVNLSSGEQDLQLANRASSLLKTANENLQRAALIYADLTTAR